MPFHDRANYNVAIKAPPPGPAAARKYLSVTGKELCRGIMKKLSKRFERKIPRGIELRAISAGKKQRAAEKKRNRGRSCTRPYGN